MVLRSLDTSEAQSLLYARFLHQDIEDREYGRMSFATVAAGFLLIVMAFVSVLLFLRTDTPGSRLMLAGVVVIWIGVLAAVLGPKFQDGYRVMPSGSKLGTVFREMLINEPPSLPIAGVMILGAVLVFSGYLLQRRDRRRERER